MESINLLLHAQSKASIEQVLNILFLSRNEPVLAISTTGQDSTDIVQMIRNVLSLPAEVTDQEIIQLRRDLLDCIQVSLSAGNLEDLAELFQLDGKDINPKLKQLIGQAIGGRLEAWKDASALGRVSLPRLQDFNWSLQFQRASSEVAEMQIPSVIMSLNIESSPSDTAGMSKVEVVDVEMSREALETMIDGLGKIRDQLSSMN